MGIGEGSVFGVGMRDGEMVERECKRGLSHVSWLGPLFAAGAVASHSPRPHGPRQDRLAFPPCMRDAYTFKSNIVP